MKSRALIPQCLRGARAALLLAAAGLAGLPAGAATITDGVATLFVSNANGEMRNYISGGVDHLYESLYFFRTVGMTQENVLVGPGQTSVNSVTQTGPTEITVLGATASFDYTLIYSLNGNGGLAPSLMLTNTSGSPLDLTLFSYQDWDVQGSPGADLINWDGTVMTQSQGSTVISILPFQTPNAIQATPWNTLLTSLQNGTVTNLDGSGLPFGPGDGTFAFQFDLSLPTGGSTSIIYVVPEPSSGALAMLGLLSLAWWGRDRRSQLR